MILQKFAYTLSIINQFSEKCFGDENFKQFIIEIFDSNTFTEIDVFLKDLQPMTSKTLLLLSEQKSIDDNMKMINTLSTEEKFALYEYFTVAALYEDFHIKMLPMFPLEKMSFNFFAYLETCYNRFEKDCIAKNLSVAEEIFSLSQDNSEQQNI